MNTKNGATLDCQLQHPLRLDSPTNIVNQPKKKLWHNGTSKSFVSHLIKYTSIFSLTFHLTAHTRLASHVGQSWMHTYFHGLNLMMAQTSNCFKLQV